MLRIMTEYLEYPYSGTVAHTLSPYLQDHRTIIVSVLLLKSQSE